MPKMSDWLRISLLLCLFGFLKEIRPSDSFIIQYLTPPWRDITLEEVNQYLWPLGTYAMLVIQIIVLLLTDYLRYKPIIVMGSLSAMITLAMLVWTTSFFWMAVLQFSYSASVAAEVAYYAYIYAKVDKRHYLKVTSHTRASLLCGKLVSGLIGQAIVSTQILDLRQMTICSLAFQTMATAYALFLPSVQKSLYFNRDVDEIVPPIVTVSLDVQCKDGGALAAEPSLEPQSSQQSGAFQLMRLQIVQAYTSRNVVLCSIWYAFGFCGYLQVISYAQMLWISIDNRPEMVWNGAVDACATLLGAMFAIMASRMPENALKRRPMLCILSIISLAQAGSLFAGTNTDTRVVSYPCYILFCVMHSFTITICSSEIAKNIPEDSYGLIFGVNTAAGIFIQALLTLFVVNGGSGWSLSVVGQFNVYGSYYLALACMYLGVIVESAWNCSSANDNKAIK